jgi:hypothetical protein
MSVMRKATNDQRVTGLINQLSEKVKLEYQKSKENGWGSNMENGIATISYNSCRHPSAALAHELLHIDAQIKGYQRIRTGISSVDQTPAFGNFLTCLDNELQHHKFYSQFLLLGFKPEQFYSDSDVETEKFLRQELLKQYSTLIELIPNYFTVIALGGSMNGSIREELKGGFLNIHNGDFKDKLIKIENLVASWSISESYDNVSLMKEIMLIIQKENNLTWFGFSSDDRPPNDGFFVDKIFSVIEKES